MALFSELIPSAGSFLVSEPFMLDDIFSRTVILLCEHDEEHGSLGFILNSPTDFRVGDFIPTIQTCDYPIYLGGPLQQDQLYFIHRCHEQFPYGNKIHGDIYFGGDSQQLFSLIRQRQISRDDIKFMMGYASWLPGQLQQEINDNTWAVYNKFPSSLAFIPDAEELWRAAILGMGPKYAHIVNFPKNPDLN